MLVRGVVWGLAPPPVSGPHWMLRGPGAYLVIPEVRKSRLQMEPWGHGFVPRYSPDRGVNLLSVEECAHVLGKSTKTVRRMLKRSRVYVEYHQVPTSRGSSRTVFIDASTLGCGWTPDDVHPQPSGWTEPMDTASADGHLLREPRVTQEGRSADPLADRPDGHYPDVYPQHQEERASKLAGARDRFVLIQPVLEVEPGQRGLAVEQVASEQGVSRRTVYRWLAEFERSGLRGLARRSRSDRGRPRIPVEAYDLVVSALVSNPPTTSTAMVHRTLLRAVPNAMTYVRAGELVRVSQATVRRIRQALLADPRMQGLFFDADQWKEFQRVYSGEVVSAHANDMWQMDMTRCDVMVVDPEVGEIFRPRIHAIVDIYSGCVPGLAFSREEDQTQTDLALLRALLPKSGPYAQKYPIYGVPRRMYWDNGKTYRSAHAERIMAGLGVMVVNSTPRVSHTRGRIERFFRTLHGFERSLPGYLGENAVRRASDQVRRLEKATLRWLEGGADPGHGERFLTVSEYQNYVLAWLIAEHHAGLVDGLSRVEHFVGTAPQRSRVLLDRTELMLLFAQRVTRVVEPNGNVRLDNRRWTVPDGSLVRFAGHKVLVLRDQFAMDDDRRLIAFEDRHGRLEVVGEAAPAPAVAGSLEAGEDRRRKRAAAAQHKRELLRLKNELTNPALRVGTQLLREAEVVVKPVERLEVRGRLGAVRPVDPRELLDRSNPLTRFLLEPGARSKGAPEDPVERAAWLERRGMSDGES